MGVSGSGKSTVAARLASALGLPFLEGDDFHSPANRAKMAAGIALQDEDRWPWLDALADAIAARRRASHGVVAACSALKRVYRRELLERAGPPLRFVYLNVDHDTAAARLAARPNHYMPVALLASQFATLEPPDGEECAVTIPASGAVEDVVRAIERALSR